MRVFLSCRRDDTAGRAGRLFDGLSARLGERNVFHHVRSIAPGVEFHEAVVSVLHDTDVTIVVIGADWSKLRLPDDATVTYEASDGTNRKLRYTSVGTWTTRRPPGWRVVADIEVSNESLPVDGNNDDQWYSSTDDVERMAVNGFAGQPPACSTSRPARSSFLPDIGRSCGSATTLLSIRRTRNC